MLGEKNGPGGERKKGRSSLSLFSFFFFPRIASFVFIFCTSKKINQNRRTSTRDQKWGAKILVEKLICPKIGPKKGG